MVDNMEWFNVFGLIFIAVIMIPNVVFAIKCKDGFDNKWNNKYVEVTEQVGRLGCFGFMIINIPGTWFGWWSDEAFALYLIFQLCAQLRVCSQAGGIPVYPRFSQPDNSESWDDAGNGI